MTPEQAAAELSDTLRDHRKRTEKVPCAICGMRTTAQSGICPRHPDGGVTGELYQRIRSQCCDISGLSDDELDKHARQVTAVAMAAHARSAALKARPVTLPEPHPVSSPGLASSAADLSPEPRASAQPRSVADRANGRAEDSAASGAAALTTGGKT